MAEKTILGTALKRRIVTMVNGYARGEPIRVLFRGTRAYTNGRDIVLPAIRDLAEIPYSTARALMGYAIHEVAHIRKTDFDSILRAIESGKMEPDKLIKKFENAIEDFRIERDTTAEFPGAASDLTALRTLIHPKPDRMPEAWFADPRVCGPLALTWTGSELNGFVIPDMAATLDRFPAPVRALIDNWTDRMKDVVDTDAVVDLAIAFAAEAEAYADASRQQSGSPGDGDPSEQQNDDQQSDGKDANSSSSDDSPADADQDDERSEAPSDDDLNDEADPSADKPNQAEDADTDADASDQQDGEPDTDADADQSADEPSNASEGDPTTDDEMSSDDGDASDDAQGSSDGTPNDDINFGSSGPKSKPDSNSNGTSSDSGDAPSSVDMDDGLGDDGSDEASPPNPSTSGNGGSANDADPSDPSDASDGDDGGEADDDPFKDVLDDNARFDDFLDDLREAIAENPLPETAGEADDGEVDPSEVMNSVASANAAAPDYDSDEQTSDRDDDGDGEGNGAGKNTYADNRFMDVPVDDAGCRYQSLRASAAGVIATTARTIRRLLMSEEQRGVNRNRRSGQFDIRNMGAIIRATGNCYRTQWQRPAPETLLYTLIDFSGSMNSSYGQTDGRQRPIDLAMLGAIAIEEATRNTAITTAIYGYTGYSPYVHLSTFKEGKQSAIKTRRKLGSYDQVGMNCTPTGEAMAAVGALLDDYSDKRRVLLVLTDGTADDSDLCAAVVPVLERRGIEVVAIGINLPSVRDWCPNSHVINDISQLPQALLSVIDPRNRNPRKLRKAA